MRLDHALYLQDVQKAAACGLDYSKLKGASLALSGATGMIGTFLTDVIMYMNRHQQLDCTVYALGRNREKAQKRFAEYMGDKNFRFIQADVNEEVPDCGTPPDYIIHAASNTHPVAYATDPIGTITANVMGLHNMLKMAEHSETKRFLFVSSVEIYGENRGDTLRFSEDYLGYIDCNTLRAGYPESKRTGEALCQAYRKQKGLDIVIPRLARTYGPTMLESDTKAISQFIKKGVKREDLILKSEGTQLYSYTYVADAVTGLLTCLLRGQDGQAYNIAEQHSDVRLRELAGMICDYAGTELRFELPDAVEAAGYSKATTAVMNGDKLAALGWTPIYSMQPGIVRTIQILEDTAWR